MPANPRPACHWPSWNPDTNRDSWIWSDKQQKTRRKWWSTPKSNRNWHAVAKQDLMQTKRRLQLRHFLVWDTSALCTNSELNVKPLLSLITSNSVRFKGRQTQNRRNPRELQSSHFIWASSCFLFLWSQPGSCFLVLPVSHLSFLSKHPARTIQLKKQPGGRTGSQMEAFRFDTISHNFLKKNSSIKCFTFNCGSRVLLRRQKINK